MTQIMVKTRRLFDVISEKGDIFVSVLNIKTEEEIDKFKLIGLSLKDTENGGFQNIYTGDIEEINQLAENVLSLFIRRNFYDMTKVQKLETVKALIVAQLNHQDNGITISMRVHQKIFPVQGKSLYQKIIDVNNEIKK
jgi:hypothetical protein